MELNYDLKDIEVASQHPELRFSRLEKGLVLTDAKGTRWLWCNAPAIDKVAKGKHTGEALAVDRSQREFQTFLKSIKTIPAYAIARYFGAPQHTWHSQLMIGGEAERWLFDQLRQGEMAIYHWQATQPQRHPISAGKPTLDFPVQPPPTATRAEPSEADPLPPPAEQPKHFVDLLYQGPDGSGIAGKPFELFINGSLITSGRLDTMGQTHISGLPAGTVEVVYQDDVDQELAEARAELKALLDGILAEERKQAEAFAQKSGGEKVAGSTVAAGKGFGDGLMGIVQTANLVNPQNYFAILYKHTLLAHYRRYQSGELNADSYLAEIANGVRKDAAAQRRAALGFDPLDEQERQAVVEAGGEALRLAAFIIEDEPSYAIVKSFAAEYASLQTAEDWSYLAGGVVFEIVLAAFSGGLGNAAGAASKLSRTAGSLRKIAKLLEKRRTNRALTGQTDALVDAKADLPEPPPLNHRTDPAPGEPSSNQPGENPSGSACLANDKACTGGEPIDLATGEELLALTDFVLPGPLALHWTRTYRSSNPHAAGLGLGWTHPFSARLEVSEATTQLFDHEGRVITFPTPAPGERSHNSVESCTLICLTNERYVVASKEGPFHERQFERMGNAFVLTRIDQRDGHFLELAYENNRPICASQSQGSDLALDYDKQNRITGIREVAGGARHPLVSYRYNDQNHLIAATDPEGHREQYIYVGHLIAQRTLKSGYSFHFVWSGSGGKARCVHQYGDPIDGEATYDYRFRYDNGQTVVTDTRGFEQTYRFDDAARLIYHRDAEGGEHRFDYDELGRLIHRQDPEGHIESYRFDDAGRLIEHQQVTGATHRFTHHRASGEHIYIDPLGHTWQRAFDGHGRLADAIDPLGRRTQLRYNVQGQLSAVTDPEGNTTHYLWDHRGRLTAIRFGDGALTRYQYDARDRLTAVHAPTGTTRYVRNPAGQITRITRPDGSSTRYEYNALGLVNAVIDGRDRTTRFEYDGLSQVRRRINPDGSTLTYHYDGERNLIALTNAKGERYSLKYDGNERLIEEIGFDGRISRYHYNKAGHLIRSQDAAREAGTERLLRQCEFRRDPLGRLTGRRSGDDLTLFAYDPTGQLIEAQNAHRQLRWVYDPAGQLIEDWQDDFVLRHEHNALGQRHRTHLPNGDVIDYGFTPTGQLTGVRVNDKRIAQLRYDAHGQEQARRFGNNLETLKVHDPAGRLLGQQTVKRRALSQIRPAIGAVLSDAFGQTLPKTGFSHRQLFDYDQHGRLTGIQDSRRGATQYVYDDVDRLIQVHGPAPETLIHDPADNLLAMDDNADRAQHQAKKAQAPGNRLARFGDARYRYDGLGNRTQMHRGKGGKLGTVYRYDGDNQLTEVCTPRQRVRFKYDPLGRRIEKTNAQGTVDYYWQEDVPLAEYHYKEDELEPSRSRHYLFEPNTFKPLALFEDGKTYYYHLDHLGTPIELSDEQGELAWAVAYKSYGNVALAYENRIDQPLRFQGQYFDEETGLHYNRHRYYDPNCGRFINQDPIGLAGGVNGYQYVPNPTGWVDPWGLTCKEINFSEKQLQKKFKHASDFGVKGSYSRANAAEFQRAIQTHVDAPDTQIIQGSFRWDLQGTHFYNPKNDLWVFQDVSGNFHTGWKLTPTQATDLLTKGNIY